MSVFPRLEGKNKQNTLFACPPTWFLGQPYYIIHPLFFKLDGKQITALQHSILERDRKVEPDMPDTFFLGPAIPGNLR